LEDPAVIWLEALRVRAQWDIPTVSVARLRLLGPSGFKDRLSKRLVQAMILYDFRTPDQWKMKSADVTLVGWPDEESPRTD